MRARKWIARVAVLLLFSPGMAEALLPADADFDASGRVDFGDFLRFATAFGQSQDRYDLDHDGIVGFSDFLAFAGEFGSVSEETIQFTSPDGTVHKMALVPPGTFFMGTSDQQLQTVQSLYPQFPDGLFSPDRPQHRVYLDAFYIDVLEVTNQAYVNFLNAQVLGDRDESGNLLLDVEGEESFIRFFGGAFVVVPERTTHPATYISWYGAQRYCNWSFGRLPTEAEWEKAARGVDGRVFPWGNTLADTTLTNFDAMPGLPLPVGSLKEGASPYGLLNMAGNAYEWCLDWYDQFYYLESPTVNPTGPTSSEYKNLRGGAWHLGAERIRSADRGFSAPGATTFSYGFRCIRKE
jgi:formylglycine-generating enzyme required for sulfatase activity